MSRIGKLPVNIPAAVKVVVDGSNIAVEGPKGKLTKNFNESVRICVEENQINFSPNDNTRFSGALYGTARSIVYNMVQGVQNPFTKVLIINGVGFKAELNKKILKLSLGFSHPINYPIPAGIDINVEDNGTKLRVEGIDKQLVGEVAGAIKKYYPVEPYKGKGIRYEGQYVIRKEGKKTA